MATPTQGERADFAAFCRNATDAQLVQIERKERTAKRVAFANIAKAEINLRNSTTGEAQ
jgi:hypothetical protein